MSLFRSILSTFPSQLLTSKQTYPDETAYGARISVWVRWIILIAFLVEVNYRVDYGSISQVLNTLYVMSAMLFNGYVHYRLWTRKTVSSRLLLAISATDIAMITFSTSLFRRLLEQILRRLLPCSAPLRVSVQLNPPQPHLGLHGRCDTRCDRYVFRRRRKFCRGKRQRTVISHRHTLRCRGDGQLGNESGANQGKRSKSREKSNCTASGPNCRTPFTIQLPNPPT